MLSLKTKIIIVICVIILYFVLKVYNNNMLKRFLSKMTDAQKNRLQMARIREVKPEDEWDPEQAGYWEQEGYIASVKKRHNKYVLVVIYSDAVQKVDSVDGYCKTDVILEKEDYDPETMQVGKFLMVKLNISDPAMGSVIEK